MKKKNQSVLKLEAITPSTLVVGIDIAKYIHWARFTDYRGVEYGNSIKFYNNKTGFNVIITNIKQICKEKDFNKVIIGMEPTGHYWKSLAHFLMQQKEIEIEVLSVNPYNMNKKKIEVEVVLVNPYHTKMTKELNDNSQTKCDEKDALTIAHLVRDGRYFETYLPEGVYAELRELSNTRMDMNKQKKSSENKIRALLDERFPELTTVFKHPFKGKTAMHILKVCPFPRMIMELGEAGVLSEVKKAVKKSVGKKKVLKLLKASEDSVGVSYGEKAAIYRIRYMIEKLESINKHLEEIERRMAEALKETGLSEYLLSIKGLGVVSVSMCLGEIGNPLRFENDRQLFKLAGYNLTECSSGKSKSRTRISKRGRKNLRCVLYQLAITMVANNEEMRHLYNYMKTRTDNPLKKKQALVVISKKILTIIFTLSKKKEKYKPERVFGAVRERQLKVS